MNRPPITITNKNKRGLVTNRWYFKVGSLPWKSFGQEDYKEGIAWVNEQLKQCR